MTSCLTWKASVDAASIVSTHYLLDDERTSLLCLHDSLFGLTKMNMTVMATFMPVTTLNSKWCILKSTKSFCLRPSAKDQGIT